MKWFRKKELWYRVYFTYYVRDEIENAHCDMAFGQKMDTTTIQKATDRLLKACTAHPRFETRPPYKITINSWSPFYEN